MTPLLDNLKGYMASSCVLPCQDDNMIIVTMMSLVLSNVHNEDCNGNVESQVYKTEANYFSPGLSLSFIYSNVFPRILSNV